MSFRIRDEHVRETAPLPSPGELFEELPVSDAVAATVARGRSDVRRVLSGDDPRPLVIVGPCSIDDPAAAVEYAERLKRLSDEVSEQLLVVMRVYFEKPRTTIGWKGLISDPALDGTGDIATGIRVARQLLLDVAAIGLPAATEFLEPVIPQYLAELLAWAAIGARTTESPTHRQLASGLSMPVGFKNGTDGSLKIALDAMEAAAHPHHFLGIDHAGRVAVVETTGNPDRHLILRGGGGYTNFDEESVTRAVKRLQKRGLPDRVLVDCAHGNSDKDPRRQPEVARSLVDQIAAGSGSILGWMIESYLIEGRQDIGSDPSARVRGLSATDPCLGWEDTERLLLESAERAAA
ncbi:MAG: 3-deoxy-7-phosphoheptulonate synthase [Gemmatimonadetes bacterium]|nr:3-deoxy-7-phosphoheptulonate synthase [Gemmatimonadota bacterium]